MAPNIRVPASGVGSGLSLQQYAQDFNNKFPGKNAGNAFLAYASGHPNLTAYQAATAFADMIAINGVDKAIQLAISKWGNIASGIGAGAVAAGQTPNPLSGIAAIGDFFGRLSQGNTWTRIAEFLVGGILIVVGASAVFNKSQAGQSVRSTAVKTAKVLK